jgi:hypothetical protein
MKHIKSFTELKESLNEREYSEEERKTMADKGLALSDGSYPIKDLEDLKNAIKAYGRAKDQGKTAKFIAKRAKELGAEDLIPDTEDFQKSLNESNVIVSLTASAAKSFEKELKNSSIPFTKISATKFAIDDSPKSRMAIMVTRARFGSRGIIVKELSLNEGVWAHIMKGVKSGDSGPWSIIATSGPKVVGQDVDIKSNQLIPAHYEDMKKKYPKAKIHIEDAGGGVVWSE